MNDDLPDQSPFALAEFARFWDGWRGRTCSTLEVGGLRAWYVRRRVGPLFTRAALPFGIPIFRDDVDPARAEWIQRYFALGRSIRAYLTLYSAPRNSYRGVIWTVQERMVVRLESGWTERVQAGVRRRFDQARRAGWEVRALTGEELLRAERAVAETDRRHGAHAPFRAAAYARLLDTVRDPRRLRVLGATRAGEIAAFQVVFAHGDYEVGWFLCSTDAGRLEHVGPFLTYAWLQESARAGCRCVDLGVSPTRGVRQFKASFGARSQLLYTGMKPWQLRSA